MLNARREEEKMLEVANAISTELQLEPLLAKIMSATTELLGADRSTLFMYDKKEDQLWSQVAEGVGTKEIRFPSDAGIAGSVFTSRETLNIPDGCESRMAVMSAAWFVEFRQRLPWLLHVD